jgi:hypothetical protein|tara:strand:+ start:1817 stop:2398 length:582 start_codon:yes stop_codon:yes gene_type:complete
MIPTTKQELQKFGTRVVKLARINLGASKMIDGKKRVTNNSGALSSSLGFSLKQKRSSGGKFASGFDLEFTSSEDYAAFMEQGVKGSESTKPSAKNSPFRFKSQNLPKGVIMKWIETKPIKLRDMGTGQFKKNTESAKKTQAFLIGRGIATKGLSARNYFKDAIEMAIPKDGTDVALAMANDFIKQIIKEIKLN